MYVLAEVRGQIKVLASSCAEQMGKGARAIFAAYIVVSQVTGMFKVVFPNVRFQEWVGSAEAGADRAQIVLFRCQN